MRGAQLLLIGAAVSVCAGCSSRPSASDGEMTIKLTERAISVDQMKTTPSQRYFGFIRPNEKAEGELPLGVTKAFPIQLMMADIKQLGSGNDFLGGIAAVGSSGKVETVWLDWNHNERYEGEERAELVEDGDVRCFKPVAKVQGMPNGQFLIVIQDQTISLRTTVLYEGEFDSNGKVVKIGFVDGDFDGKLTPDVQSTNDNIVMDYDGDGVLGRAPKNHQGEYLGLAPQMALPDGHIYFIESGTTKEIKLTRSNEPLVAVDVAKEFHSPLMVHYGELDYRFFPVVDGKVMLPAGSYTILAALTRKDSQGNDWLLHIGFYRFVAMSGSGNVLTAPGKFTPILKVHRDDNNKVHFQLMPVSDECDVRWISDAHSKAAVAAKFTVTNERGTVVHRGEIIPWGDSLWGTWAPPSSAKGKFMVTATSALEVLGEWTVSEGFRNPQ